MRTLIVVERPDRWPLTVPGCEVVAASRYLTAPEWVSIKHARVLNLCRSYRHQSTGHYVSLLAEARGHRPIPTLSTIQDLKHASVARTVAAETDALLQKALRAEDGDEVQLRAVFGQALDGERPDLCAYFYRLFPAPFLRVTLSRRRRGSGWVISTVGGFALEDVPVDRHPIVQELVARSLSRRRPTSATRGEPAFDLAILLDPNDPEPPSDEQALQRFERAAAETGFAVERITRQDYERLPQFDALFIRETTELSNHTYRFARRAAALGLVVIDDPVSIMRCTNKVYLAEVLARAGVPMPQTVLVHKDNVQEVGAQLGFPCVLKLPDSSFSRGVVKAADADELARKAGEMLARSELLVAQRFVKTDFDWRIGVLDGKPLYACRYFMARHHWQVVARDGAGDKVADGRHRTVPIDEPPAAVIEAALAAAGLMGDGLYGVDLKDTDNGVLVIEVNDNPSLDGGVEDQVLGAELYRTLARSFAARIQRKRGLQVSK